jgi:hypothetical protein
MAKYILLLISCSFTFEVITYPNDSYDYMAFNLDEDTVIFHDELAAYFQYENFPPDIRDSLYSDSLFNTDGTDFVFFNTGMCLVKSSYNEIWFGDCLSWLFTKYSFYYGSSSCLESITNTSELSNVPCLQYIDVNHDYFSGLSAPGSIYFIRNDSNAYSLILFGPYEIHVIKYDPLENVHDLNLDSLIDLHPTAIIDIPDKGGYHISTVSNEIIIHGSNVKNVHVFNLSGKRLNSNLEIRKEYGIIRIRKSHYKLFSHSELKYGEIVIILY